MPYPLRIYNILFAVLMLFINILLLVTTDFKKKVFPSVDSLKKDIEEVVWWQKLFGKKGIVSDDFTKISFDNEGGFSTIDVWKNRNN